MAKKWTKELFNNKEQDGIEIATELWANIREQDAVDVAASGNDIVFEICACLQLAQESWIYRGERGELLCIMGISKFDRNAVGRSIYMLGTDFINGYKKELLIKEARQVITQWVKQYGCLFNAVYSENERSIRWLKRMGAEFLSEGFTIDGKLFYQFVITERGVAHNV